MKFVNIVGQYMLKKQLIKLSSEGKLSHAIMFCEEPGYGALPLAVAFAQYICCKNKTEEDSCGTCPSCNKFQKLIHPDLHFAIPVNNNKKVTSDKRPVTDLFIETWREELISNPYLTEQEWYQAIGIEDKTGLISVNEANAIIKKLGFMSFEGGDKFMIIWLPENMNKESSNKILKILEEPPVGTYFFLVTQSPETIISTIISRCQLIKVKPLDIDFLAKELADNGFSNSTDAKMWSRISGGSYGTALSLIKGSESEQDFFEVFEKMLDHCVSKDLLALISLWEEISTFGREKQKQFCIFSLDFLRKCFILHVNVAEVSNISLAESEKITFWAKKIKADFYPKAYIALNKAISDLERNVNSKFVFSDLSNRFFISL